MNYASLKSLSHTLENTGRSLNILSPARWARKSKNKVLTEPDSGNAKTMMEVLANDSNLWLSASRSEERGDFISGMTLYLKDAKQCLKARWMTRAALSCSCTANCMLKAGHIDEAHRLYAEAGAIYVEHANKIIGNSMREALWSLQQAHESYYTAQDQYNAQRVYEQYVSLASKISPFYNTKEKLNVVDFTKRSRLNIVNDTRIKPHSSSDVQASPLTPQAKEAIEEFFTERFAHKGLKTMHDGNAGVEK